MAVRGGSGKSGGGGGGPYGASSEQGAAEERASSGKREESLLGDMMKKILTTGITAAFMTEESIRAYLSELKLPKEVLNLILQQAGKSKEELTLKVAKEISQILAKVDLVKEASRFVENHKFKISAEIEVLKKEDS